MAIESVEMCDGRRRLRKVLKRFLPFYEGLKGLMVGGRYGDCEYLGSVSVEMRDERKRCAPPHCVMTIIEGYVEWKRLRGRPH